MVRFTLFGIPVEIQPWFWLILALFGSGFAVGDGVTSAGIMQLLLFMIAGAISVLVHEFGHALTGKAFGASTAITLHAFGGYATFPAGLFKRWQDFVVTAAGPAIQIVLGILSLVAENFLPFPEGNLGGWFLNCLAGISIFWAVLNLIPVIPLDGGRLMSTILGPRRIGLSLQISMVIAIIAAGLMLKFSHSPLFPLLLGLMAYQNWQEYQHLRGRR